MAVIQNDRDILLQAASPRVVPIPIPMDRIDGLPQALKSLRIKSSATTFMGTSGATNPAAITLTAEKLGGLTGAVTWAVIIGSGTLAPSGDNCVVTGSTVSGYSITIRARVTVDSINYDAQITLSKLGALSGQEYVNLTNQVVGQLANGNVSGLGALALLNYVNLNTQTTGALNGVTQVTNLGDLAYANAIAANQIGAGQLAAGVIYAGNINAYQVNAGSFVGKEFTGGTFTGAKFQTAASGARVTMETTGTYANQLVIYNSSGSVLTRFSSTGDYNEINANAPSNGTALTLQNNASGSGWGLRATAYNAVQAVGAATGIYASANNTGGVAGDFVATNTNSYAVRCNGVLKLEPRSSFPSNKAAGSLVYHTTYGLCVATGADWRAPSGWTVVG